MRMGESLWLGRVKIKRCGKVWLGHGVEILNWLEGYLWGREGVLLLLLGG